MKNFLKILLAFLVLLLPATALATTSVPWSITNLTDTFIFPNLVNGSAKGFLVSASSTVNGNFSVSNLTSGNCVQAGTGGVLTTIVGACGSGSGTPGGLNTQVQYNNAGAFGGVSGATTNGTILSLTNALLGGATLTTSVVNGVTLTTAGSATTFLNGAGNYTTPTASTFSTTSLSAVAPLQYSQSPLAQFSITKSGTATDGYLSSADFITFNNKISSTSLSVTTTGTSGAATYTPATGAFNIPQYQAAGTYLTSVAVASTNGLAGSSSGGATPTLTLSTNVTGVVKANGTAFSAAANGTDYTLITANTCGAGQFFNSATAAGVLGCGTPAGTTYTGTFPIVVTGSVISSLFSTTTNTGLAQGNTYIGSGGIFQTSGTSTPTVSAPITYSGTLGQFINGVSGAFGCTTASAGVTGCLSGTDWSTFNNKQPAIALGAGTINSSAGNVLYATATSSVTNGTGISFTGTPGALIGGTALTITNSGVTSNVAGTGIGVSGATGAVTISNTGVTSIVAGTNITVSGSTGAVTINATGGGSNYFTNSGASTFLSTGTNLGIGTSTPFALLGVSNNVSTVANTTLFAIASTTLGTATTTLFQVNPPSATSDLFDVLNLAGTNLFSISNIGSTTLGNFGGCNTTNALTTNAGGTIVCGAVSGGSSLTGTTGQAAYFSGTNTAVGTSSLFIGTNGQLINKNGNVLTVPASYTVSTTTSTGDFTDIQSAINALPSTGGLIHVKCGIYTLPTATYGILVKVANTKIIGEGNCTQLNMDKANTTNGFGMNATSLAGIELGNLFFNQTNATFGAIAVNASNTPLIYVHDIKMQGFATTTSSTDTINITFYQHFSNLDMRGNTSCIQIGSPTSNPVNDNSYDGYLRCGLQAGNKGIGLYVDANSANGSQNLNISNFNSEPIGAGTGLTAIRLNNAVDVNLNSPYVEGNAIAYSISSTAQRINFFGGEFVSNTTYTNNGSNVQFIGTDKESVALNQFMASTSIVDVTGNDASVPDFSISGNNSFAKSGDLVRLLFANSTDSGNGIFVNNPGTGAGLKIISSGTGQAASTTGKVFLQGLSAASASANVLCRITTTGEIVLGTGATTCAPSSIDFKRNVETSTVGLSALMQLRPVTFFFKENGEAQIGLIAQEVNKIDTRLTDKNTDGTVATINWGDIDAVLIKSVQDQQKEIEAIQPAAKDLQDQWQWIAIEFLVLWNISLTFKRRKKHETGI